MKVIWLWTAAACRRFESGAKAPQPKAFGSWLSGPIGKTTGIGADYFRTLAAEQGYVVNSSEGVRGLIRFKDLSGPGFDPDKVHPEVREFYEATSNYELESWSEWCGVFKPFGYLLAMIFSRRLPQLNVPLQPLDTAGGTISQVVQLKSADTGDVALTAWVRLLRKTGNVLYAGAYSVVRVPGHGIHASRSCFRFRMGTRSF